MVYLKQEVTLSNSTSNVVIKVENLGKKYVINHEKGNGDDTLRDVIVGDTISLLPRPHVTHVLMHW